MNVSDILLHAEEQQRRGRRSSIHSDSSAASSAVAAAATVTSTYSNSNEVADINVNTVGNPATESSQASSSSTTTAIAATSTAIKPSASAALPPPRPPVRSYAAAASKSDLTVELSLGNVPVSRDTTIFAAAFGNEQRLNHIGNATATMHLESSLYFLL